MGVVDDADLEVLDEFEDGGRVQCTVGGNDLGHRTDFGLDRGVNQPRFGHTRSLNTAPAKPLNQFGISGEICPVCPDGGHSERATQTQAQGLGF